MQAVRRLLDLPSPYEVWDRRTDLESLPKPVQHVAAVMQFKGEVENGGISQYFFNTSGNHWPVALEAFRAMGAAACEDILKKATEFAGPGGASTDRERRIQAYARLSDQKEKYLDDLSTRFYKDEDRLEERVMRYMGEHAEVMRGRRGQPVRLPACKLSACLDVR